MGGRSMTDVGGAVLAGSSPPFLGRERAAVVLMLVRSAAAPFPDDDGDVYYYIRWRLKLDDVSPVFFVFVLALLFSHFSFSFSFLFFSFPFPSFEVARGGKKCRVSIRAA